MSSGPISCPHDAQPANRIARNGNATIIAVTATCQPGGCWSGVVRVAGKGSVPV